MNNEISLPSQQLSSNFTLTQYCSSILTHNTIFYELRRLQQESDIYNEFPFHRQLSYVSEISSFTSSKVVAEEVSVYYLQNNLTLPQDLADKTLEWYKIITELRIRDKGEFIYLNSFPSISKNDILKACIQFDNKSSKIPNGIYYLCDLASSETANTNNNSNQLTNTQSSLNTPICYNNSFYLSQYTEKIFETFNKRVLFQYIFSSVLSAMSKLALNRLNVDYSIQNLILIREGQNIKFTYLTTFTGFASDLQQAYSSDPENFNYKQFSESYYLDEGEKLNKRFKDKTKEFLIEFQRIFLNEAEIRDIYTESAIIKDLMIGQKSIEEILSQQEQRRRFTKQLIANNQILNLLTTNQAIKESFLKLIEQENIVRKDRENMMSLQAKRSIGQQDPWQFQLSNSMMIQAQQKQISLEENQLGQRIATKQCQILNQFLQGCLALTKTGNPETSRFIFTCEEFNDRTKYNSSMNQQQLLSQTNIKQLNSNSFKSSSLTNSSSNNSSMPYNNSKLSDDNTTKLDQVNSLFDSQWRLQIILRIIETQGGSLSQSDSNSQIEQSNQINNEQQQQQQSQNINNALQVQAQQQQRQLSNGMQKSQQAGQTPSQTLQQQQQQQLQQYQQQTNKYIPAPNLKATDKKLYINFSEPDSLLTISLIFLPSDISVSLENIDEIIYTFQILNQEFAQFSIYSDEVRQVIIESQVSTVDIDESVLLVMIYTIDRLIAYGLAFFEFYTNNIQAMRVSRDTQKYKLFTLELYDILAGYQSKYNKFLEINKL